MKYDIPAINRGYTDRLLSVDLSAGALEVKPVSEEDKKMYTGGRGYCLKLVYDGTTGKTKHDSPENVLAIAGGPFCGETAYVGAGKFICGTISPLTGSFCDSNVGGHFFALAKMSGFDAISVTGKSDRPVMIVIDGDAGELSIVDAPDMKNALGGAEELLEKWRGDAKPTSVAFINTGEGAGNTNFGCINSVYYDTRRKRCRAKQAGRGGTGTVMRNKNLWGILVKCNASKGGVNKPADSEKVREAGRKLREIVRENDPKQMRLANQGTTVLMDMMNSFHLLPVNNYQYGSDEREKQVSGHVFEKNVFVQNVPDGCFPGCNLGCTKGMENHELVTGPNKGQKVGVDGPEYETAAAVTNMGVFDVPYLLDYSWYCDEYGVDTISAGVVMAFAVEAYERGYLTKDDTCGRELKFSDPELMMELLHSMCIAKDSFSREVGKGIRQLKSWIADTSAPRLGRSRNDILAELREFGMECKGLEFSMYICKESLAQQGGYGFALKGPQHDEAWLIAIDQLNRELPSFEKKAAALKWFPLFRTWFNMVGLCKLPWIDVRHPEAKNTELPYRNMPTVAYYIEFVNATLGTNKTIDDILEDSERCYMLHKLINVRQGFGTRQHDRIPMRAMAPLYMNEFKSRRDYYMEYLKDTAEKDVTGKSDEELLSMLQDYRRERYEILTDTVYNTKGYDENGIPTDEALKRLGMDSDDFIGIVAEARNI